MPDAIWFDNAEINEQSQHDQPIAQKIQKSRADLGFNDALYFGGVAFKYQANACVTFYSIYISLDHRLIEFSGSNSKSQDRHGHCDQIRRRSHYERYAIDVAYRTIYSKHR